MNKVILFDRSHRHLEENGTVAFSDILYVPPGRTALLSLYDMRAIGYLNTDPQTGKKTVDIPACVMVHKLTLAPTGDLLRRLNCGDYFNVQAELQRLLMERGVRREPVFMCGEPWQISPCNNMAVIALPGFYMLAVCDAAQFDTTYIESTLLTAEESAVIPDYFKLGVP
uniref:Uncharacterized protein n=1 Tax=Podoviridae sp. ctlpi2 TaxID=2826574 RepID=A0A8S5MLD3_9CAUD|nr:MAG TPA: hypothetical protein [Podoviridae sp. ctlpi2]